MIIKKIGSLLILLIVIAVALGAKAGGGEDYYKTLGIKRDAN